jgi:hypothetical protein
MADDANKLALVDGETEVRKNGLVGHEGFA